jgi:hypothetical protein
MHSVFSKRLGQWKKLPLDKLSKGATFGILSMSTNHGTEYSL